MRGASRSSRTLGYGMRWTQAARLTRALNPRTAKSCGPDAPTLASSFADRNPRGDGGKKARLTGESTKETVKTIARGMPGDSGVTVVTMLVCSFYFACEAAGASRARHSLRPLIEEGGRSQPSLARNKWRDRGPVSCRHCEERSDEAIHSSWLLLHG